MRRALFVLFAALAAPAHAADPLAFDIGRDRVLISCAAFLSARIEEDVSVDGDGAEQMKNAALALLLTALDARAPEGDPLRDTHHQIVQQRMFHATTGWRVRMQKNLDAHASISGDDQVMVDEQIVCNELFRQLRGG